MTFVEAIQVCRWVRRRSWLPVNGWMVVSRHEPVVECARRASSIKWDVLTYEDLIADDWTAYVDGEDSEPCEDDTSTRFSLLELE